MSRARLKKFHFIKAINLISFAKKSRHKHHDAISLNCILVVNFQMFGTFFCFKFTLCAFTVSSVIFLYTLYVCFCPKIIRSCEKKLFFCDRDFFARLCLFAIYFSLGSTIFSTYSHSVFGEFSASTVVLFYICTHYGKLFHLSLSITQKCVYTTVCFFLCFALKILLENEGSEESEINK